MGIISELMGVGQPGRWWEVYTSYPSCYGFRMWLGRVQGATSEEAVTAAQERFPEFTGRMLLQEIKR